MAVGVWTFVALTVTSGSPIGYARTLTSGLATSAPVAASSSNLLFSAQYLSALQGQAGALKIWTRALSANELMAESMQRAPVSRLALYDYAPLDQPAPASGSATRATEIGRPLNNAGGLAATLSSFTLPVPEELAPRRTFLFLTPAQSNTNNTLFFSSD
jgi:hypothetical protein